MQNSRIVFIPMFLLLGMSACKPRIENGSQLRSEAPAAERDTLDEAQRNFVDSTVYTLSVSENGKADGYKPAGIMNGFKAFAMMPMGVKGTEAMPFIFFKLIPDLSDANDTFDGKNYEKYGFWKDPRFSDTNLPLGFTMSYPLEKGEPSYLVRTCGSCHISRVRLNEDSNSFLTIDGAGNHELRLHRYNTDLYKWILKKLSPENRRAIKAKILSLVDQKQASSPNFFFGKGGIRDIRGGFHMTNDGVFEKSEIAKFKKNIDDYLEGMYAGATARKISMTYLQSQYELGHGSKANSEDSPAGIADSGGLGIASMVSGANSTINGQSGWINYLLALGKSKLSPAYRELEKMFPRGQDLSDRMLKGSSQSKIPSVWQQNLQEVAQWDGSVKSIMFRNLVAALGLIGKPADLDIPMSEVVSDFIGKLPAPKYPFDIDTAKAARGQAHYNEYCAGCHVPNMQTAIKNRTLTETPIFKIGTDENRQKQMTSEKTFRLVTMVLMSVCQNDKAKKNADFSLQNRIPLKVKLKVNDEATVEKEPCQIDAKDLLVARMKDQDQGYLAKPLTGLWATAPYLHNGSVPTLRHLLDDTMERPAAFATGLTTYDQKNVGWAWEMPRTPRFRTGAETMLDTRVDGLSNGGHKGSGSYDEFKDRVPQSYLGKTYKLSFSGSDSQELDELMEYLKQL